MPNLTVIGIDPGSRNTGWGIVCEKSGVLTLVECGVIRPSTDGEFSDRLAEIFHELTKIIDTYSPDESAIEQVFGGSNPATALKLGQARGVACAACASRNIRVTDYEPRVVKKAIVGVGSAEKSQVAFMVGRLLGRKVDGFAVDATDALGVAICHLTQHRFMEKLKPNRRG